MAHRCFYATAEDLLPVFERVEASLALAYTSTDTLSSPLVKSFHAGASLPSLHLPAEDSSALCKSYLVTPFDGPVKTRTIQQSDGAVRYAVDQILNPDSITLTHGGLCSRHVLISGRIATCSDTHMAKAIQSAFSNAIGKLFVRVSAFRVGPNALKMLDSGGRLTIAVQSPPQYDLRRSE